MNLTEHLHIRPFKPADVYAVTRLTHEHAFTSKTPLEQKQEGFLVSGYSASHYLSWRDFVTVAELDGGIVGFSLAFPRKNIPSGVADVAELLKRCGEGDFLVSKQIAVAKNWQGRGVGKALYRFHQEHSPGMPIYAPILFSNVRSRRFHESAGFYLAFTFYGETDGSLRGFFLLAPPPRPQSPAAPPG